MLLKRAKIEFQLSLIVIVMILGFLPVWGVSQWQDTTSNAAVALKDRASGIQATLEEIHLQFITARIHEKEFLLRPAAATADRHAASMAGLAATLTRLQEQLADHDRPQAEEIKALTRRYDDTFRALVSNWKELGLTDSDGLRGTLRNAVAVVQGIVKAQQEARIEAMFLTMRVLERDFMLSPREQDMERLPKIGDRLTAAVEASELSAADKDSIRQYMGEYKKAFQRYAEVRMAMPARTEALSLLFAQTEPLLTALQDTATRDLAAADDNMRSVRITAARVTNGVLAAVLVVMIAVVVVIALGLTRPLAAMTRTMQQLADGNLRVTIPAQGWKNAIGQMAATVAVFKTNAETVERLNREAEAAREKAAADRTAMMNRLAEDFEQATGAVTEALVEVSAALDRQVGGVARDAREVLGKAGASAASADTATTNVEAVAAAAEELSAAIGEISGQVERSARLSRQTAEVTRDTLQRVDSLSQAAGRIGEVVSLITAIADQTNLLALNATIEAARAGDAGKGFAVVANEVKTLAGQTARATEDIARQVNAVQAATADASGAISAIAGNIHRIDENMAAIAASVEQQGAATQEIARNVHHAAEATRGVSNAVNDVAVLANTTSDATGSLNQSISDLRRRTSDLQDRIGAFLRSVRSA